MSESEEKSVIRPYLLVVFAIFAFLGAINIWELIFPPTMTYQCAYLLNEHPPEQFSFISESTRESAIECLYLQKRYNQKLWIPRN